MSVSSEITRIEGLRDRLKTKLKALGLLSEGSITKGDSGKGDSGKEDLDRGDVVVTGKDLSACAAAMDNISGSKAITGTAQVDVAGYQYAQVRDANLRAANIAEGVKILGITGTHSGATPNQNVVGGTYLYGQKEAPAIIYPPDGYLFYAMAPQLAANTPLVPENIKEGVQIMGVTGKLESKYKFMVMPGFGIDANTLNILIDDNVLSSVFSIKQIFINVTRRYASTYGIGNTNIMCMSLNSIGQPTSNFSGITRESTYFQSREFRTELIKVQQTPYIQLSVPSNSNLTFYTDADYQPNCTYEALIVYEE